MNEPAPKPLRDSAYRGAAATVLQQGGRIVIQMLSVVILARLLPPEEFGIFAMVLPIVGAVGLFQGLGLLDAVIQRREITPDQINTLYWINFAVSIAVAVVIVLLAPVAAWLYEEPRVAPLMAAWALVTLISAAAQQQYAVYVRELRFLTLALIDLACAVAGLITSVVCAIIFQSYWALWASGFASALLWALASTAFSTWRPGRPSIKRNTDGMLKFGAHLTGVGFVDYLVGAVDKVLLGRFWGPTDVGLYDRAYRLLLFPLQNLAWPLSRVAIPLLAKIKDEPQRLRRAYLRFVGQINMLAVPAVVVAVAAPHELVRFVLGDEWLRAGDIFAWLGFAAMIQPMTGTIGGLFTVQGRTGEMLRCSLINGSVMVIAVSIGALDGAVGVARACAAAQCLICTPVLIFMQCRRGPMQPLDYVGAFAPFAVAAAATWGVVRALAENDVDGLALLAAAGFISYGFAFLAMLAFPAGRETLQETRILIERGLSLLPPTLRR